MSSIRPISLVTALLAGCALALPALAQSPGSHPAPAVHRAVPHPAFHRPVPHGTYRVIRPGVGFHRGPVAIARIHPFHTIIGRHVAFARFTPAQRALWAKGRWAHRWWHGRYGWWWNAGGVWFWYAAPVYPYPTVVSDYYYEEPVEETGPTWWYCYNPAGYYPYIPSCSMPWTPVPAQGYGPGDGGEQRGPDQGPPMSYDQGPPPGNDQGPPPGNDQGPPGYDQGPPGYDQGPPPGYDQGQPPDSEGPPPGNSQYPHSSH